MSSLSLSTPNLLGNSFGSIFKIFLICQKPISALPPWSKPLLSVFYIIAELLIGLPSSILGLLQTVLRIAAKVILSFKTQIKLYLIYVQKVFRGSQFTSESKPKSSQRPQMPCSLLPPHLCTSLLSPTTPPSSSHCALAALASWLYLTSARHTHTSELLPGNLSLNGTWLTPSFPSSICSNFTTS